MITTLKPEQFGTWFALIPPQSGITIRLVHKPHASKVGVLVVRIEDASQVPGNALKINSTLYKLAGYQTLLVNGKSREIEFWYDRTQEGITFPIFTESNVLEVDWYREEQKFVPAIRR